MGAARPASAPSSSAWRSPRFRSSKPTTRRTSSRLASPSSPSSAIGFLIVLTDVLVRNKQITTISAIYFGLLLGLLLGNIFSTALEPFIFSSTGLDADAASFQYQRKGLALLITVVCCYVSISTLLQTKDEFRFIIPYVEFSKQVKGSRAAGSGHQCHYRRPDCRYL